MGDSSSNLIHRMSLPGSPNHSSICDKTTVGNIKVEMLDRRSKLDGRTAHGYHPTDTRQKLQYPEDAQGNHNNNSNLQSLTSLNTMGLSPVSRHNNNENYYQNNILKQNSKNEKEKEDSAIYDTKYSSLQNDDDNDEAMNEPPIIHSLPIDSPYRHPPPPITSITIKSPAAMAPNYATTIDERVEKTNHKKSPTHQKKFEKFIATRKSNKQHTTSHSINTSPSSSSSTNRGDTAHVEITDSTSSPKDRKEIPSPSSYYYHHSSQTTPKQISPPVNQRQSSIFSERNTTSPPTLSLPGVNSFEELVSFDIHNAVTPKKAPSTSQSFLHSFGAHSPSNLPRKKEGISPSSPQQQQQQQQPLPDEYSFHVEEDVEDAYVESLVLPLQRQPSTPSTTTTSIAIPDIVREGHVFEKEFLSTTRIQSTIPHHPTKTVSSFDTASIVSMKRGGTSSVVPAPVVAHDDDSVSQATLIQYYGGIHPPTIQHTNSRSYHRRPRDEDVFVLHGNGEEGGNHTNNSQRDSMISSSPQDMKFGYMDEEEVSVLLSFADNTSMLGQRMADTQTYKRAQTDLQEGVTELRNMTMRDPSMPMAIGISAAALIGAFFLGPVGVVVGTAAVGLSVGIMQIPEAQRTHAVKKLNEFLDSTYQSVCSTDTSPCVHPLDGNITFPSNTGVGVSSTMNPHLNLKDSPNSSNQQYTTNDKETVEGNSSPIHHPRILKDGGNGKVFERQVMVLRKNKILPLNQIHSLDPSKQPRAWLDVLASASSSIEEKSEAMEEIIIWSKDKVQARRYLEVCEQDSSVFHSCSLKHPHSCIYCLYRRVS